VLIDTTGQPCRTRRSGGLVLRPVDEGSGERQVQAAVYGDAVSDGPAHSLGRPVRQYDTAGEVRMSYDFRGRVVEQVRRVFEDIETEADWEGLLDEESLEDIDTWLTSNGALSAEEFTVGTEYDALDRVVEQTLQRSPGIVRLCSSGVVHLRRCSRRGLGPRPVRPRGEGCFVPGGIRGSPRWKGLQTGRRWARLDRYSSRARGHPRSPLASGNSVSRLLCSEGMGRRCGG
jgi:hypothetical protein